MYVIHYLIVCYILYFQMMGAIQWIEDLEEEEDSEDMKIKKRRRGRRHT